MKKGSTAYVKILVIALTLLSAHTAALVHDADHPFHEASQACDGFLALDNNQPGLDANNNTDITRPDDCPVVGFIAVHRLSSEIPNSYFPRAPPLSSQLKILRS